MFYLIVVIIPCQINVFSQKFLFIDFKVLFQAGLNISDNKIRHIISHKIVHNA